MITQLPRPASKGVSGLKLSVASHLNGPGSPPLKCSAISIPKKVLTPSANRSLRRPLACITPSLKLKLT
jgi:hypothetical protein